MTLIKIWAFPMMILTENESRLPSATFPRTLSATLQFVLHFRLQAPAAGPGAHAVAPLQNVKIAFPPSFYHNVLKIVRNLI